MGGRMKRIVILLLVVCMMVGLSACGSNWHDDLQINAITEDHRSNFVKFSIKNESEKEISDGWIYIEFEYKGTKWTITHSFKDISPSDSTTILVYATNAYDDYTINKVTYIKQDPVTN